MLDDVVRRGWDECHYARRSFSKAFMCGLLIGRVQEAGGEVAMVGGFALGQVFGPLVQLVELPLRGGGVEPGEAGECECCCSARED